jgi:hypothetical protein
MAGLGVEDILHKRFFLFGWPAESREELSVCTI